jgi:hypothetical protein
MEVINPDINATWVNWAYFSPDNQYVAIISVPESGNSGWPCQLYILPIDYSGNLQESRNNYPCPFYG